MINKFILISILLQFIAISGLFIIVKDVDSQSKLLPSKIDMLVDASQDNPIIKVDIPECPGCPPCPECKDYSEELKIIRKSIKNNSNKSGVYYYYSGCQ